MDNFVPMNMIPFIANMRSADNSGDKPQPEPFNPHDILNKVVTMDFGEAEKIIWQDVEVYALPIDSDQFMMIRNMAQEVGTNLPSFKLRFEDKDYVIISYTSTSMSTIEELVDIDMDDASMTEHQTFEVISMFTDTETGDSVIILAPNE